jgi:hypothetical protein
MAARGKFVLNKRTVGHILKHDGGLKAAVHDTAEDAKDRAGPGATVEDYTTDRVVSGIVVGATDQAMNGTATRAAQQTAAAARKNRPFTSRAEWRRAFAAGDSNASTRAHASSWAGLPEKAPAHD